MAMALLIVNYDVNSQMPPTTTAGYFPKLNPVMPNVNQKRKSSADHKFDWLESREEERKCIDSLVVTIDKWVDTVRLAWQLSFAIPAKRLVQSDHGGQGLGFVDFAFVVPLSAQLCLGWLELGRNARAVGKI